MTRTNLYMSLYGILPLQRKQKGVNRALRGGGKEVTDGLAAKGAAGRGRAASFLGPGKADRERRSIRQMSPCKPQRPRFSKAVESVRCPRELPDDREHPKTPIWPTPGQVQKMDLARARPRRAKPSHSRGP